MDIETQPSYKKDNQLFLFLSCVSCNSIIVITYEKGQCTLPSFANYLKQERANNMTNLFAFTCCRVCDVTTSDSNKKVYVLLHPEFARRCTSYDISHSMAQGDIDIAMMGYRVAFIDRNEIGSSMCGVYTVRTVDYLYSRGSRTLDSIILPHVDSRFLG